MKTSKRMRIAALRRIGLGGRVQELVRVAGWRVPSAAWELASLPMSLNAAREVAVGLTQWRSIPALSGAARVAVVLARAGVEISAMVAMKTSFIPREVGGGYRHACRVVCDGQAARAAWGARATERMASQGGQQIRTLFGCTSRSRAGVEFTPDGVVVYQDQ